MMNPSYTLPDTPDFFQTTSQFPDVFTPRQAESHKGTYGTLAVVGGASGMSGAVVLASLNVPFAFAPKPPPKSVIPTCTKLRPISITTTPLTVGVITFFKYGKSHAEKHTKNAPTNDTPNSVEMN